MASAYIPVLFMAVLAAAVVGVDVAFFRHHTWTRLMANIGIVLVFGAFYLRLWDGVGQENDWRDAASARAVKKRATPLSSCPRMPCT